MENAVKDFAAGMAAGVATVLTGHPFDTVKVKLQTQNTEVNTHQYHNAIHCTITILKTEGAKGLYRGATSSFVGVALESSVLFGAYSQMKSALQGGDTSKPQLSSIIPSAAVGGACISMILCPTELVKCRLQVQAKDAVISRPNVQRYDGPLDCLIKTLRSDGVQGLFRGGITTFMRESMGNAVFFTTYEISRYYMLSKLGMNNEASQNQKGPNVLIPVINGRAAYSKAMLEAGVDIISGGLAGMMFYHWMWQRRAYRLHWI